MLCDWTGVNFQNFEPEIDMGRAYKLTSLIEAKTHTDDSWIWER